MYYLSLNFDFWLVILMTNCKEITLVIINKCKSIMKSLEVSWSFTSKV